MHMGRKKKRCLCLLTAAAVMLGGIQLPAVADAQESGQEARGGRTVRSGGVTVKSPEEFMAALQNHQSPITVSGSITIGGAVSEDKRMLPVKIPGGTVIQGTDGSSIVSRSPIQLEGDNVHFQDIELNFNSTDAMGSVPHREIFLGGYSLTLDNVSTYLEGGGGASGGLLGSEKELLPTVYAGGFTGSAVGSGASLTVTNSNDKTMFKGIYMGHNAGSDNNVPYTGNAVLRLDAKAVVREEVDTSLNNQAEINITGTKDQTARVKQIYGNEDTALVISSVSAENVLIDNIGNITLKDKACLAPTTDTLHNITLQNGACLDFNGVTNAVVSGDFVGESSPDKERGILVLNAKGTVSIHGEVRGTTQFQTGSRAVPGTLYADQTYIYAKAGGGSEPDFVLPQSSIDNGFNLKYTSNGWMVYKGIADLWAVEEIRVLTAPQKVDLEKISQKEEGTIPDQNTYFDVKWYNGNGTALSYDDIIDIYYYYDEPYVIPIRTDYWESDDADIQGRTDWRQAVSLMASKAHPDRYFLQAQAGAQTGNYTFLFCSDNLDEDEIGSPTVADVNKLKCEGKVKA